jgi:UDP-GlcNAc3NAcA epimerase
MTAAQPPTDSPLAICYGTRPQAIKASALIETLGARWNLLTIDTGQHYDYEMNFLHYQQLGITRPHHFLEVGSDDHASQIAAILTRAADILNSASPWAAVVIGDTNSTLGCALAAAKLRIPVVHVEAGLRASNSQMQEEINRRVVDAISALLCAPSHAAEERLRLENVNGYVVRTGDVAYDVLLRHMESAPSPREIPAWPLTTPGPFVFSTLHRAELTDDPTVLAEVLSALGSLSLPLILALHPRTRDALQGADLQSRIPSNVHMLPPLGYLETIGCVREAEVVITDSGGVQREAYWLGTPCVTLRSESEWQETLSVGANVLVEPKTSSTTLATVAEVAISHKRQGRRWDRSAYGEGDAALRIRDAIASWRAAAPPP